MLSIVVLGEESTIEHPDGTVEFVTFGGFNLELEHSLVSLSKWEQFYEKPFLTSEEKTEEEILGYIKAMALHSDVPEEVFKSLTADHFKQINEYMNKKMTATWVNEVKTTSMSGEIITNELIYYWMAGFGLPMEMQYWHLNRLFMQLKVANLKSQPPKKMARDEWLAKQRMLNDKRRKELESSG